MDYFQRRTKDRYIKDIYLSKVYQDTSHTLLN